MSVAEETAAIPRGPSEERLSLRTGRGQALLGSITLAHFSHHTSNSLLNPLLPLIRDAFGLSYAQSGFAVSAFALSSGLANAPWGAFADRVGSRAVIVGGLVLMAGVSVALSLSGSYEWLLVMLVAMGIVSGSYHAPAAALIAKAYSPSVRGAVMGMHITGGHLSFFAAPLVAGILATGSGTWRTPYLWFAIAPLVCGALLWLVAPKLHERPEPGDRFAAFREIGRVFRDVGPLVSLAMVFQLGFSAVLAFLALYLVDARGIPAAIAAAMFGVVQLVGVVGAPLGGALSDRIGRKAVIIAALGVMGPAIWAITAVPNELLLLPLIVVGLGFSMRSVVTETLVLDSAPPARRGTVLGAYYLVNQEIGGIAAPVFGLVATVIGIAAAMSYIGIALVALSAIAVVIGRRL
ncbi:MAG TPA: MFS transporter [Candidatus Limnocylindria bacterium]|nr:MFS transporter [Candidatus Limnocylindria bacterium]